MDAKEAIRLQFMTQYAQKDFTDITVKGLCAAAPVARTTFYSYYNNTDDVRQEIEDDLIRGLLEISDMIAAGNYPDMDFSIFMDETEKYIKEHWSDIYAFLVRQPNLRFIRKWKDAIKMNFRRRYPEKQHLHNNDAIAEIVASSVISIYTYWMENPETTSVKEIKPLLHKLLDSLVNFL
ncbi:MAG: TetR/AcrR family transcriptional regulator [Clostridia bacterium]|nr:TetR/AcrR family transcriptional regulator [Clostridia bacterium]